MVSVILFIYYNYDYNLFQEIIIQRLSMKLSSHCLLFHIESYNYKHIRFNVYYSNPFCDAYKKV